MPVKATVHGTAQTGLVYKNFLLLYMRKYKPVYSLVYELSVQAQITIKMTYKNCKLAFIYKAVNWLVPAHIQE